MENNGYDWDIMIFQNEELPVGCSWGNMQEEAAYYDSGSPDGGATATSSSVVTNNNNKNNIVLERNRRNKLKDRLHALRAAVPKISKMDRASIIKDAIEYIYQLQEQEKIIQAEILELESSSNKLKNPIIYDQEDLPILLRSKKKRTTTDHHHGLIFDNHYYSPIQIIELRVKYMGGKMFMVNLTCSKRTDTMVKLSEVFESLKLKVITAHITSSSATLLNTVFIQADEEEKDFLEIKIHTAISALNDPQSPMSI